MDTQRKRRFIEHWQKIALLLVLYDLAAIHLSYFAALLLRFDFLYSEIPEYYLTPFYRFITLYAIAAVAVLWRFRLYRSLWRFASYTELIRTAEASFVTSALHTVLITLLLRRMPLSYYIGGAMLQFALLLIPRFGYRLLLLLRGIRKHTGENARVLLIGGGAGGQMLLREVNHGSESDERIVCIIDDNPNKWGRDIDGVPVVGGRDEILSAVERYGVKKIYFAIPSATAQVKRDILNICNESGCEIRQLPGLYQIASGQVSVSKMKPVAVEDLLGREPIRADMEEVFSFIHGKTVLVTGGGGSIGSELCRQIAAHSPKQLLMLDIYENGVYDLQLELQDKYPELDLKVLIGSVRDSRRMFQIFDDYRPQIVYHAAAHKHVPLMEANPCESIKNNTIGTYKTAYAAMLHGCERFVLISTDKAVNPTNIMGASKRLCEMVVQSFDAMIKQGRAAEIPQLFTHGKKHHAPSAETFANIKTEFSAVRFGNVLGSNGSVIPIFKKQIERGGPVTVTHPDIIRYFMTIPEAVSLVMLAGTYAKGGEIFVLDMGSPVKIDTLARNLIRLSGLKPDVDIKIQYTGLRPGEKLYEEKLMSEEGLQTTENELIFIGKPLEFDHCVFFKGLECLMTSAYENDEEHIRLLVSGMVKTYREAA